MSCQAGGVGPLGSFWPHSGVLAEDSSIDSALAILHFQWRTNWTEGWRFWGLDGLEGCCFSGDGGSAL